MRRALPHLAATVAALALAASPASAGEPRGPAGDAGGRAAVVFQDGLKLKAEGRLAESCDAVGRAAALTPDWGLARYEHARCLRLLGDLDGHASAAIEAAERVLQRAPIYVEKGRLAEDRGDAAAAAAAYEMALQVAPAEVRALFGLARVAREAAPKEALERAEQLVQRYPGLIAAWRELALAAEAKKKLPRAEEALRKVVELSPNKRAAWAALGTFAQRTRQKKLQDEVARALRR
ncbi:MAG: tetratricopeptide repeat protein [Myxococcales bacterium]|nr:tetratricopeptide repeat protein [Myxococcales bacterium]MCB9733411.1 tetratricopeptide repeat protein [Deltaproteobacteria bacterium]